MAMILCVDDEPELLKVLVRMLERLGHSVRTAASVHEALQVIAREAVDLIITDWSMRAGCEQRGCRRRAHPGCARMQRVNHWLVPFQ